MLKISEISESELQVIHDMAQVVFRHTYVNILSPEQMEYMMEWMYSLPNLRKQLEEGHHYYVAKDEEVFCGYVSVQREGLDAAGVEVFHLHKIYVMPDYQGKGVGRFLLDKAISHVKAYQTAPSARIELNVNKYNKAVNFYKHIGMRILLEEDFPIGNGFYKTDFIMGLDV